VYLIEKNNEVSGTTNNGKKAKEIKSHFKNCTHRCVLLLACRGGAREAKCQSIG
jgi:hypothetical protein